MTKQEKGRRGFWQPLHEGGEEAKGWRGHEKRADVRVDSQVELMIRELLIGERLIALSDKPLAAKTVDISSGGVQLSCQLEIPAEQVCFSFAFQARKQEIPCLAEVIRRKYTADMKYYACRFINLSPAERDVLRQFVFAEQIRLRNQWLEDRQRD